eukprot:13077907-Alexandrium_andersonii.AAC.1
MQDAYRVPCPGYPRDEAYGRRIMEIPMVPPHEALQKELVNNPAIPIKLQEQLDAQALPPCYDAHPVVRRSEGSAVVPLSLYMDAVPYSETDSACAVWLINMVTNARHVLGVVR